MNINPSDPEYQLYKTFTGINEELFILDCARSKVERQFKDKSGYLQTAGGAGYSLAMPGLGIPYWENRNEEREGAGV